MAIKSGINIKNVFNPQFKELVAEAASLIESSPTDRVAFVVDSEGNYAYEVVGNIPGSYDLQGLKEWQLRFQ